jgi:hypothetical protein
MIRDPVEVPRKPGIFALMSKSARVAYVAYTSDLQKRSHSLSHMVQNSKTHWSIKNLPKLAPDEFIFMVLHEDVRPERAAKLVAATKDLMRARKYRVIEGARSPTPLIRIKLNGGQAVAMSIPEAMKKTKCRSHYITVWRRIERGWTPEQALDIDDPPVRWDREATQERRRRAASR